ncbi:MAG: hypothetical protein V1672_00350 [Candidatus Diapherotrites archaeon]
MKKSIIVLIIAAVLILFSLLLFTDFFNYPTVEKLSTQDAAVKMCRDLCELKISDGGDLSAGPCIGNPIQEMPNYVCDIAHNPRTEIDNLPENQCSAFRENNAEYFIELDENCELIKIG